MRGIHNGQSQKAFDGRQGHSPFVRLRRHCLNSYTASPRLLACAVGLVIFQSVLAMARAPHGSVYVPLDSWVYTALDRLAGMGEIDTQFVGARPWTRIQCAQLVLEARQHLKKDIIKSEESRSLHAALRQEFGEEINLLNGDPAQQVGVESVYSRAMGISGTPLRDSYNYGQSFANDFGRPLNTGFNNVTGFSARAAKGRFFAYVRGEYQYSPAYAGLTQAQQAYIELRDGTPSAPYSQATGRVSQFDLLDIYVGVRIGIFDATFGKQSLWWGPGTTGGMLYSTNIDPVFMLKVNQVQPIVLPSILRYLGPVRVQAFYGRLADYPYPHAPYIHGEKIMLKPTPNLEVGFSRTAIAFGQGIPFTFRSLVSTYFSFTDIGSNPNPQDFPGKRFGGLDFSYRLPYLRRWVTVYTDNISSDDANPLVNPSRASYNPGVYVSQVPRLPKLDFRFEVASTRTRAEPYTSFFYKEGYTNKGFLIGNTVGRRGAAIDASGSYWFSPRKRVQVGWREEKVSKDFIPSGGSQNSVRVKADWLIHGGTMLSVFAQHERWAFPFLASGAQSDNIFSLQLTVHPQDLSRTALKSSN